MASGPIKRTKLVDLTLSITYFKEKVKSLSCIRLFATLWTVALQASPSMGFSQQEYWSGLPFPSPGDLSDPAVEPASPALQAGTLLSEPLGKPWSHHYWSYQFMSNRWGNNVTLRDFIFLDSKITADGDCSHGIKRHLLLGRKAVTNLDSMLESRDITLLTKVRLVNAMVFPVVMYGCESWTVKKAGRWRIDAFELWC